MSGHLPPTGPRHPGRGRGGNSQRGHNFQRRPDDDAARRADNGRSRGDRQSSRGISRGGSNAPRRNPQGTGYSAFGGVAPPPAAARPRHGGVALPPPAAPPARSRHVQAFIDRADDMRSFYPPANHVDQANTLETAGEGLDFPRCFHCGRYKLEECTADEGLHCQMECFYCKDKSHNGKRCPRLWCTSGWWKKRMHFLPPRAENDSLRPNDDEVIQLHQAGYRGISTIWTPLPGPQAKAGKRKADDAGFDHNDRDDARNERVKRKLTRQAGEKIADNLRSQITALEDQLRSAREENARLNKRAVPQPHGVEMTGVAPGLTLGARFMDVAYGLTQRLDDIHARLLSVSHAGRLMERLDENSHDHAVLRAARDYLAGFGVGAAPALPTDRVMVDAEQLLADLDAVDRIRDGRPSSPCDGDPVDDGVPPIKKEEESEEDILPPLKEEDGSRSPALFIKKEETE